MKEKFKKLWDFHYANLGEFIQTFEISTLKDVALLEVRYTTNTDWGSLNWDIKEYKLILINPEHASVLKAFGVDLSRSHDYIDADDALCEELDPLQDDYHTLYQDIDDNLLDAVRDAVEDDGCDFDDLPAYYKDFNEFWAVIKPVIDKTPIIETVKLNNSYKATIVSGSPIVEVGCQRFEVSAIEALLAAHKKLNP